MKYKNLTYLLISFLVILIITSFFVFNNSNFNRSDFPLDSILYKDRDILLEDTLEKVRTDNNTILYLISDIHENIHFIAIDENEILLNSKIIGEKKETENNEVVWFNTINNKKKNHSFYGIILNDDIYKLSVNDNEIPIISYQNNRVFFSTDKYNVPILIKGYSKSDELIYKNFQ